MQGNITQLWKRDGIESCVEMQMDLDSVTQSEVSQKEKKKSYIDEYM